MGHTRRHFPTLLFAAIFSKHVEVIEWGRQAFEKIAGPEWLVSPMFDFEETKFYETDMGSGLKKQLLVYEQDFDPAQLADLKIASNQLEREFQLESRFPESRALNIDPGYLSEAKLVLATTKDRDHRIYLRDGIYAEVTLYYLRSGWQFSRWSYPDYRRTDYQTFLTQARNKLRSRIQNSRPVGESETFEIGSDEIGSGIVEQVESREDE